jgi:hypothetical protein
MKKLVVLILIFLAGCASLQKAPDFGINYVKICPYNPPLQDCDAVEDLIEGQHFWILTKFRNPTITYKKEIPYMYFRLRIVITNPEGVVEHDDIAFDMEAPVELDEDRYFFRNHAQVPRESLEGRYEVTVYLMDVYSGKVDSGTAYFSIRKGRDV